jgi:transposase-like protein
MRLLVGGEEGARAIAEVKAALVESGWEVSLTARALDVSRRTMYNWLKRYPELAEARYNAKRGVAMKTVAHYATGFTVNIPER